MSSFARMLFLLALVLPAGAALAAPNCGLAAPPPGAGIDRQMGILLKIHPRTPDIGPDYGGCQTLWAQSGDGWEVLTVAHYEAGHVVRVENPAVPHDPVEQCVLKNGAVLRGDPELCSQLDEMRFESLPADCLDAPGGAHCVRR
jgi:hypothetical protein